MQYAQADLLFALSIILMCYTYMLPIHIMHTYIFAYKLPEFRKKKRPQQRVTGANTAIFFVNL